MLTQNLKMNNQLRQKVISNKIAPEELVKLSNMEMSKPEVLARRAKQLAEDNDSRKTDIMDVAREKIMKKLGVDTSRGDMRCRKCKGYNISINPVQTRSSDEPMTLFCHCIDCKAVWRQY